MRYGATLLLPQVFHRVLSHLSTETRICASVMLCRLSVVLWLPQRCSCRLCLHSVSAILFRMESKLRCKLATSEFCSFANVAVSSQRLSQCQSTRASW